jgi:hypothetical protein
MDRKPTRMDGATFPNARDALSDSKGFFPVEFQDSCHERCSLVFAQVNETLYLVTPLTQRSAVHWCC